MNNDIKITNEKLAYFESLKKNKINNFFTFSNETWGGMGLSREGSVEKYKKIFTSLNITYPDFLYMGAEQNNNVQIIDKDNLKIYKLFNSSSYKTEDLNPIVISGDCIITKLSIPIVVTPADCSVICMIGVDKKDNTKFIIFIHSGVYGTMLKICEKALKTAHAFYEFDNKDLGIYIYPSISQKYYIKNINDAYRGHLVNDPEWKNFIEVKAEQFGLDIEGKIVHDLVSYGITDISISGLDAYIENEKGNLFSFTYSKEKQIDSNNFAVGVLIE